MNTKQKSRSSKKKETASALRITSENDTKNTLPEVRLFFMFFLFTTIRLQRLFTDKDKTFSGYVFISCTKLFLQENIWKCNSCCLYLVV